MITIGDYEIEEPRLDGANVIFVVRKADESKCDRDDLKWIDDLIKHLGKWERMVNGISLLLGEISVGRGKHYEGPFGYERYSVKTALCDDGSIRVTMSLTKKEELIRTRNGGPDFEPKEVECQLHSLVKWVAFVQSVRSVPLF